MSVIKLDKYLNSFFKLKLQDADKELYDSIRDEFTRQQNHIELIASENIAQKQLEAQGSVLTNKYAEGYPSKDIMVVVNTWMFRKTWLLSAQKTI